jgi:GTP cyclohydrolase I
MIAKLVRDLIKEIGEDPDREGLVKTPERVERMFAFLTSGYAQHASEVLNDAVFQVHYDEIVLVRDIDFYSLCEHHLLPFFGKCHVGYLPDGKIVGLSKLVRLVEMYSRRLQVQERLTCEIADAILEALQPRGVAVVIEAYHLCMMMRGVEKQNSLAVTSSMQGIFRDRMETRAEFMQLIRRAGG